MVAEGKAIKLVEVRTCEKKSLPGESGELEWWWGHTDNITTMPEFEMSSPFRSVPRFTGETPG
jgi:hypothetical protein